MIPASVLWMLAADHAIPDTERLHRDLAAAEAAARAGRIVTFGMHPTAPETGYGYIECGAALPDLPGVHALARFIEKPDPARAAALAASGHHLWNSGMFVFTAETLLAEMAAHAPDVLEAVGRAVAAATRDLDFIRLDPDAFRACRGISLDYAVAERTERAAVVPTDLGWSDVGSWGALWDLGAKDAAGNVAQGEVVLEDCAGCYARSDGILTAVLGLRDVVLVATGDAVLAMPRARAQDVKQIVERLKARGTIRGARTQPCLSSLGLLRDADPGRALPGQAHRRRSRPAAVVAETLSSRRALGRGRRQRAGDAR